MKECLNCHQILPLTEFYIRKRTNTLYHYCKKCRSELYFHKLKATDKYKEQAKAYRKSSSCAWQDLRKGARRRGIEFLLNKEEFSNWFNTAQRVCSYCSIPQELLPTCYPEKISKRLSVDRKDNTTYNINNLCFACDICNLMKSNVLSEQEMLDVGQRYIKPKWQHKLSTVLQGIN